MFSIKGLRETLGGAVYRGVAARKNRIGTSRTAGQTVAVKSLKRIVF